MAKCETPHARAEELILPAALDMVNIMLGELSGKLISNAPLLNNDILRFVDYLVKGRTIDGTFCATLLDKVKVAITEKTSTMTRKKVPS